MAARIMFKKCDGIVYLFPSVQNKNTFRNGVLKK